MMRADVFLTEKGYVKSRQSAKNLIEAGKVTLDGGLLKKPSELIDESLEHSVELEKEKYVCRGALKLEGALDNFSIDPMGMICIDIGASTGGFTDLLLKRGAKKVYAVDSGHGQLDDSLIGDERVENIEGYNARYLKREDFPCLFELAVMDVSFISQAYIHKGIADVLSENGILISLIKPQFEAGRSAVGKGGIVKRKEDREAAITRVVESARECGLFLKSLMRSPIDGGDGNIEFLALFCKKDVGSPLERAEIRRIAFEGKGVDKK